MDRSMSFGRKITPFFFLLTASLSAQVLSNASLNAKYFMRHLQFTTDATGNVTDARSITGTVTFNGAGAYSFTGQQVTGTSVPLSYTVSGQYAMTAGGVLTLTNPQKAALQINARYSSEAVIGSSTEGSANTFDFLIAIPAPAAGQTLASITGPYFAADFELTGASMSQVRNSFVSFTADGKGNLASVTALGHAANLSGSVMTQFVTGANYAVNSDGTGTLAFPFGAGQTQSGALLNSASRSLQVSSSGNIVIAATAGAHDIVIAVKAITGGTANNASVAQSMWFAGLRADPKGGPSAFAGSRRAGAAAMVSSRRLNYLGATAALNETDSVPFTVAADGSGSAGYSKLGLGTAGKLMAVSTTDTLFDPTGYEIGFAMAVPALSGPGVFINPLGVVNAASGAPALDAISPGEFIAIYGSNLANSTAVAAPPYPKTLVNVSVTIGGIQAPLYFVSPGQLDVLVPYGVTGSTAAIVVTSNGSPSNTVTVPLANTSPGIFTLDSSGSNDGAILHADYSIITVASPAKKGDIVSMYLTGLGAVVNPISDGSSATGADAAKTQIQILVGGIPATVYYAGLSALPGLYQVNFQIPANLPFSGETPVAILTAEAFHDQVTIAVQ